MSRRTRERQREAAERWPTLAGLLAQDRLKPEAIVDGLSIEAVGRLLEEWRDWNANSSWGPEAEGYLADGFGLQVNLREGRTIMNRIYDQAVRRWRASGKDFSL